jgi:two-component system chemotaxis response regulator CheB
MLTGQPIRVLVVDDSILTRRVISTALGTAPDIVVVGTAGSGAQCLAAVEEHRPDVVTLDVEMPGMDGLETLGRLVEHRPIPVIMVSYLTTAGAETTVRAMLAGAVDVVAKPGGPIVRDLAGLRDDLVRKVRAAARSRPRLPRHGTPPGPTPVASPSSHPTPVASPNTRPTPPGRPHLIRPATPDAGTRRSAVRPVDAPPAGARPAASRFAGARFERLVVIGSSTGGPGALRVVTADLPADRSTAYLLVQHMPAGMTAILASMLNDDSPLDIREAHDGDSLEPGVALIAPGDFHLRLGPGGTVHLDQGPKVHWVRPSVDVALLSAAELHGDHTVAAILTGIGSDGADGAAAIHAAGGTVIAEHESTCVVYGMPKAVVARGLADAVVPLHDVARTIASRLASLGRPRERLRA